jgi:hypothetical protein
VSYVLNYILIGVITSTSILTWEHAHDSPEDRNKVTPGAALILAALWPLAVVYLVLTFPYRLAAFYLRCLGRQTPTASRSEAVGSTCPSCSRGLPAAARYCRQCGHRVGSSAPPRMSTGERP